MRKFGSLRTVTDVDEGSFGGQGGYGSSDEKFGGSNADMLATLLDHNVIEEMQVSQRNLGLGGISTRSGGYGAFAGYNWQ